jgi:hypothetical protein
MIWILLQSTVRTNLELRKNGTSCGRFVLFLRSVQLHFATLAGVLSDIVKSDLYGLTSHPFQKPLKSKFGSSETRHPLSQHGRIVGYW